MVRIRSLSSTEEKILDRARSSFLAFNASSTDEEITDTGSSQHCRPMHECMEYSR